MPAPYTNDMRQMLEDIAAAEKSMPFDLWLMARVEQALSDLIETWIMETPGVSLWARCLMVVAWRASCRSN